MTGSIHIRATRARDLPVLAELEEKVWRRHGTPILSEADLEVWYNDHSPYFLVAEADETLCGYYYGRQVHFSPAKTREFLDPSHVTGSGYSRHEHDPSATSVYGISVAATIPGAGETLNHAIHALLEEHQVEYFLGFTRLSMFDHYCKRVEREYEGVLPYPEEDIALWYAHESAKLLLMRSWDEASPQPVLSVPPLRRPDPVLGFHVRGTQLGLLEVLPHYMPDPGSRDYGAFIASSAPHR